MALAPRPLLCALGLCAALLSAPLFGQEIRFGGLRADPLAAVEVTSDAFQIDQASHAATFDGNVVIHQGDLVLQAGRVTITYGDDMSRILSLEASGGVMLKAGADAAQAASAVYDLALGQVRLAGDVLLTQGSAAISGQSLVVNLKDGTGRIEGRVTTTFLPATGNN